MYLTCASMRLLGMLILPCRLSSCTFIQRLRLLFQILGTQDRYMIGGILYNFHVAGNESWLHGAILSVKVDA